MIKSIIFILTFYLAICNTHAADTGFILAVQPPPHYIAIAFEIDGNVVMRLDNPSVPRVKQWYLPPSSPFDSLKKAFWNSAKHPANIVILEQMGFNRNNIPDLLSIELFMAPKTPERDYLNKLLAQSTSQLPISDKNISKLPMYFAHEFAMSDPNSKTFSPATTPFILKVVCKSQQPQPLPSLP